MQIIEIKYQRVKNLGNYETERVEMTALIDDEENVKEVFSQIKLQTLDMLELIE